MQRRHSSANIHESFSDVALLMLATFVFLLVFIIITSRVQEKMQTPALKKSVAEMAEEIEQLQQDKQHLCDRLEKVPALMPRNSSIRF